MELWVDDIRFVPGGTQWAWARDEVWTGNAPACVGHKMSDGTHSDKWLFYFGAAETYQNQLWWASINLGPKINLFICDDFLNITDKRHLNDFKV